MRKLLVLAVGLMFACNSSQKTVTEAPQAPKILDPVAYGETITENDLKDHLYTYASDEFEGRETGTAGQKKAVEYLKSFYEEMGIPAAQANGDYFQNVPLEVSKVPVGNISINNTTLELGENIVTFSAAKEEVNSIVYVGYGIEDGEYSDYNGIDVKGKFVLIKAGEPVENGIYTLTGSMEKSVWSNASEATSKKTEIALNKGAKGVLYFDALTFPRFKGYFEFMKNNNSGRMQLTALGNDNILIYLDEKAATAIKSDIETDNKAQNVPVKLSLNIAAADEKMSSENVVAILKGSEKPDEYVIISSHLDHIGITDGGQINNGADDDGSGTVALLEIAQAFKKAADEGNGPKRSIVFLHVTGEEKGLLGSQYYTDVDPIFPLENTVVDLNIDMIGRIDPNYKGQRNYLYLIGSDKLSSELHELSEDINKKYTNIEFDYTYNDENDPNRFYYRSDHYNFAKNNIPIIFYFNGTHEDYHRPGDTPDKINYDLLENRSRLIFYTAWEIANKDNKLVVDKATD
ncbi:M28 family peptidase [Flagellimonas zhangzhouensis]|uniref:PA domain-containing protein n=1 Tax=Flagellimonas zhangzhouensis TaxID=1073328 RepID=A0A1H2SVL1_9FLAO|nr:M28 family peptidase [Allomuricauda zhangzhouensis]SDQ80159.1 Peptidase family M28 [Allomuricauda zhangzhouensis]SDW35716.1 PA domain-containing protein [Allomuricauda zhangzhouensis]